MRRALVLLLLLVPAFAGCVEPEAGMPLLADDLVVAVDDPGGHVVGREVVLRATPVLDGVTYRWTLGDDTHDGPVLRRALEPGTYEVVLTATRGEEMVQQTHAFEVLADPDDADGDGAESGGADDGAGAGDGSAGADAGTEACGFTTEAISAQGEANVYTIGFPWTCQPDSWEWDLGDGTRSREATVQHAYRRDGAHTVTLTLEHDGGTRTYTKTLQVRDVPLRILPTVAGDRADFTLDWGRDVASAAWDLDDGATSPDLAPSHTYSHAGPWTVQATATDAAGKSATARYVLFLDAYPLHVTPQVDQDTVGLTFHWGWTADTVRWTVGPDCAFTADTGADDAAPKLRCGRPGTHSVRLEVEGEGRTAAATTTFEVEEVPLRIEAVVDGDRVAFEPVWHGDLSNVRWSFGDGTTSTEVAPSHDYRAYGTFPVRLTATGGGETLTAEEQVTVEEVPLRIDAALGPGNVWGFTLDWVSFPDSVAWDLGDGTTVRDQATVQHAYARKGTYTVRVTATDGEQTEEWEGQVTAPTGTEPDWGDPEEKPVRPGAQMTADGLQCTTSFLFHQDWDRYFLATAAHCAGTAGDTGGQFSGDCARNRSFPLGSEVTFRNWETGADAFTGTLAYSSWKTMADEGVTDVETCRRNDFALVEVDRDDLVKVHPAVLWFGGPTGLGAPGDHGEGTGVRSYGASSLRNPGGAVGDKDAANAKGGTYDSYHGGWTHAVQFDAPAVQGDSGGPLLTATGEAIGVLSTVSSDGTNQYTDLAKAVAWMEELTGLAVGLVEVKDWESDPPVPSSGGSGLCPVGDLC